MENFKMNIDLQKAFHTQVMAVDEDPNESHGYCIIEPGADGPPIHTHPVQEETFFVLDGELDVYKENKWHTLKAGDSLFIPKNTAHSYRSRYHEQSTFEYRLTPKGKFTEMLQTFERLMVDGKLKNDTSLSAKIYLSMVFKHHQNEIKSVSPPHFIISLMNSIGKMIGYRLN